MSTPQTISRANQPISRPAVSDDGFLSGQRLFSPLVTPIYLFLAACVLGGVALMHPACHHGGLTWLDAFFTATSAVCVTGLIVVDTGSFFTHTGHWVIMVLIQLGGLGIITYASLAFYLWRQKISLTDRIMVGQSLMQDPTFHFGTFLRRMFAWTFGLEAAGALALWLMVPEGFSLFSAMFHAVSAFCNAGFALQAESVTPWADHVGVNVVFMGLIVIGGIGFSVLVELPPTLRWYWTKYTNPRHLWRYKRPSLYALVVVRTTFWLIISGALVVLVFEYGMRGLGIESWTETALTSLFQSVTLRTAGFNTMDIGNLTSITLVVMIVYMFIGGSPGSTAGGLKTTTFITLVAFMYSNLRGRKQTVIGPFAVDEATSSKAFTLLVFAGFIVSAGTLGLLVTEVGGATRGDSEDMFLELLFEAMSAFCTVGLSTGVTPGLSDPGKIIVIALMFLGRLGPILFLSVLQSLQEAPHYRWPEENMLIG